MHPILFQLGPLSVRMYGALVALAFVIALRIARWTSKQRGLPEHFLLDLAFILVVSGLVGARLFFVGLNADYFWQHPLQSLLIWRGGLVFYGGFIVATLSGVWYTRRNQFSVGTVADCLAPAIAIGQSIGRWGCFFAGCCYGKPSNLPWSVTFKDPLSLAPLDVPLHPAQLYESLGDLVVGLILIWQFRRREESHGEIFWMYVFLYGALRFGVEFLRGDDRGPLLGGLYPSQLIAISAMLISGSILAALTMAKNDASS